MSPRSHAQDAERKRAARAKRREEKAAQAAAASQRKAFEDMWQAEQSRRQAELMAKLQHDLEYSEDPQRGVERVERAIRWLQEAEAAGGDRWILTNLSIAIQATLGSDYVNGINVFQLPSWSGAGWCNPADIRRVLLADLESRGLMKIFEQKRTEA
jgi:hypothetical protein